MKYIANDHEKYVWKLYLKMACSFFPAASKLPIDISLNNFSGIESSLLELKPKSDISMTSNKSNAFDWG